MEREREMWDCYDRTKASRTRFVNAKWKKKKINTARFLSFSSSSSFPPLVAHMTPSVFRAGVTRAGRECLVPEAIIRQGVEFELLLSRLWGESVCKATNECSKRASSASGKYIRQKWNRGRECLVQSTRTSSLCCSNRLRTHSHHMVSTSSRSPSTFNCSQPSNIYIYIYSFLTPMVRCFCSFLVSYSARHASKVNWWLIRPHIGLLPFSTCVGLLAFSVCFGLYKLSCTTG